MSIRTRARLALKMTMVPSAPISERDRQSCNPQSHAADSSCSGVPPTIGPTAPEAAGSPQAGRAMSPSYFFLCAAISAASLSVAGRGVPGANGRPRLPAAWCYRRDRRRVGAD